MKNVGMFFRVREDERERFRAWSEKLKMSQSDLFHALIQLDKIEEADNPPRCVVFDTKTTRNLAGELKRWGYHFNQANHALNSIVYLLRLEEEYENWAMGQPAAPSIASTVGVLAIEVSNVDIAKGTAVGILDRILPMLPGPNPFGIAWGSCNPGRS